MTIALEIPRRPKISTKDEVQWDAVVARDRTYDGKFYYSVATTGVYCRPSCPSRLAKRVNVRFHDTRAEAEAAGFRPCKRCGPDQSALEEQHMAKIANTCRLIEAAEEEPKLDELAQSAGLSAYHFRRIWRCHIVKRRTRELCVPNIFKRPSATASRHVCIADARKARCVLAEVR